MTVREIKKYNPEDNWDDKYPELHRCRLTNGVDMDSPSLNNTKCVYMLTEEGGTIRKIPLTSLESNYLGRYINSSNVRMRYYLSLACSGCDMSTLLFVVKNDVSEVEYNIFVYLVLSYRLNMRMELMVADKPMLNVKYTLGEHEYETDIENIPFNTGVIDYNYVSIIDKVIKNNKDVMVYEIDIPFPYGFVLQAIKVVEVKEFSDWKPNVQRYRYIGESKIRGVYDGSKRKIRNKKRRKGE